MAALVTLKIAKDHLRLPQEAADADADVQLKVEHASGIVLHYLKSQAVAGWSDGSVMVPSNVEAATLLMLAQLWEHRGDDTVPDVDVVLKPLLVGYRDPALA